MYVDKFISDERWLMVDHTDELDRLLACDRV